jgi:hypothetical protein
LVTKIINEDIFFQGQDGICWPVAKTRICLSISNSNDYQVKGLFAFAGEKRRNLRKMIHKYQIKILNQNKSSNFPITMIEGLLAFKKI